MWQILVVLFVLCRMGVGFAQQVKIDPCAKTEAEFVRSLRVTSRANLRVQAFSSEKSLSLLALKVLYKYGCGELYEGWVAPLGALHSLPTAVSCVLCIRVDRVA
jgi:hypothetical protein